VLFGGEREFKKTFTDFKDLPTEFSVDLHGIRGKLRIFGAAGFCNVLMCKHTDYERCTRAFRALLNVSKVIDGSFFDLITKKISPVMKECFQKIDGNT